MNENHTEFDIKKELEDKRKKLKPLKSWLIT